MKAMILHPELSINWFFHLVHRLFDPENEWRNWEDLFRGRKANKVNYEIAGEAMLELELESETGEEQLELDLGDEFRRKQGSSRQDRVDEITTDHKPIILPGQFTLFLRRVSMKRKIRRMMYRFFCWLDRIS